MIDKDEIGIKARKKLKTIICQTRLRIAKIEGNEIKTMIRIKLRYKNSSVN